MISMRYARNLADGFGLCGIQVTRLDHDALRERLAAIHPHAPPHTGGGHGPPLIAVRDTLVQTT